MAKFSTKHTEQAVLNDARDESFDPAPLIVQSNEFDGENLLKKQTDLVAMKVTKGTGVTYIGIAPIGSSQSDPVWQCHLITVSGNDTVFTWADSNANFDNIATDLTALTYG